MNSKFFRVTWLEIKEAIVVAIIVFLLTGIVEIVAVGDIWGLDWKTILNNAVIATLSFIGKFLTSLLTTSKGTLAGVKIK